MDDRALRDRNAADARIVRARRCAVRSTVVARSRMPDAALAYVARADPAGRLAGLFMLRSEVPRGAERRPGAEEDLGAAIETFERKRSTLTTAQDRMQAFERERAAFKDLVRLEIATRGDEAALRISERARAGVLLENWSGPSRAPVDPTVAPRHPSTKSPSSTTRRCPTACWGGAHQGSAASISRGRFRSRRSATWWPGFNVSFATARTWTA